MIEEATAMKETHLRKKKEILTWRKEAWTIFWSGLLKSCINYNHKNASRQYKGGKKRGMETCMRVDVEGTAPTLL
jgi:hypothetical protein